MRVPVLLAAAALAAGCSRCGGGRPQDGRPSPAAVAVVNGERIEAAAVARELRDAQAGDGGEGRLPDAQLRRRALDELVERALLLQEARARAVAVEPEQVERAFQALRAEYPGNHFDDLLAQEQVSEAELKDRLRDGLTIERLFETQVFRGAAGGGRRGPAPLQPSTRPSRTSRSGCTRSRSWWRRGTRRRRCARSSSASPGAFAEVARASSIAPEGKDGGDLGFIGRGSGFPEVFDVCFKLPLNAVSDVIPSPYGFHVFKVVEKKPARRRTLEEARAGIAERLGREQRARAQAEYLEALRRRASIQIDEQALATVTP